MMGRCFSLSPLAGEGRGEEPLSTVSDSRKGPLTRNLRDERADSDLSSPSKAGVNALMGKRGEVLGVGLKRLPIPQPGKVIETLPASGRVPWGNSTAIRSSVGCYGYDEQSPAHSCRGR